MKKKKGVEEIWITCLQKVDEVLIMRNTDIEHESNKNCTTARPGAEDYLGYTTDGLQSISGTASLMDWQSIMMIGLPVHDTGTNRNRLNSVCCVQLLYLDSIIEFRNRGYSQNGAGRGLRGTFVHGCMLDVWLVACGRENSPWDSYFLLLLLEYA